MAFNAKADIYKVKEPKKLPNNQEEPAIHNPKQQSACNPTRIAGRLCINRVSQNHFFIPDARFSMASVAALSTMRRKFGVPSCDEARELISDIICESISCLFA